MSNKPIRCFDGNGKPFEAFWNFRNAEDTESGETELELYGPISEFSWYGDEVTPKLFKEQLYSKGGGNPVTVRLNSPGGDLIAASVISSTIRDYPGKVTIKIDGLAASAAVMVAIGGDVVKITASAYMMIHDPAVGLLGYFSVDELKGLIDELKVIKNGIIEGYMAKTKMEAEKLSKLMNDVTYMTASEAVSYGFADEVITGASKSAANKVNYVNLLQTTYGNVPLALMEMSSTPQSPEVNEEERRKAKRLAARSRMYLNTK
jgi:ATP-dependent protease ClpP protease subunit